MLRLGVTNDVDLAPLFFPIEAGWAATPPDLTTSDGNSLSELEQRLLAGQLDIAPIGPLTYAQHQKELFLLPYPVRTYDIAADALFMISKKRMDKYETPKIAVAPSSATGEAVVKIIGRHFYHIEPTMQNVTSEVAALDALKGSADICIVSGETGMRAVGPAKGKGYFVEDLTKAWWLFYELPLPLVLFAVRRAWTEEDAIAPLLTRATMQMFRSALQTAKDQMPTLTERAEKRTGLPAPALTDHYAAQRYEFKETHLRGLLEFYRRATLAQLIPAVDDLAFFPPLGPTSPGPSAPPRRTITEQPRDGESSDRTDNERSGSRPRPTDSRARRERAAAQGLRVIKGGKDPKPDSTEGEEEQEE